MSYVEDVAMDGRTVRVLHIRTPGHAERGARPLLDVGAMARAARLLPIPARGRRFARPWAVMIHGPRDARPLGLVFIDRVAPAAIAGRVGEPVIQLAHVIADLLMAGQTADHPAVQHVGAAVRAVHLDGSPPTSRRAPHGSAHRALVDMALDLIGQRLDDVIMVGDIAKQLGVSARHLTARFNAELGVPPRQYILRARVARARHYLLTSDLSLADVAAHCGFAEQSHFTRVFARITGQPPGLWRRLARLSPNGEDTHHLHGCASGSGKEARQAAVDAGATGCTS